MPPPEILYTLGRLRAGANQLLPATTLYERAIKTTPKRSWRIELAAIYDFAGKTDEAIRLYQALLGEADDADLRRELGLTLLIAKRPTEAVVELEKSLEAKSQPWDTRRTRASFMPGTGIYPRRRNPSKGQPSCGRPGL